MDNQNKKEEQQKPETQETIKTPEPSTETIPVDAEPAAPAETPAATPESPADGQPPVDTTADTSAEPVPQPVYPDVGYTETKSSKLVYILVGLLLLILLSLVGLFFYKQMAAAPAETQISPSPVQVSPTVEVSPTVTPVNEEEADLQQIEIPDIDQDLQQIESDLDQL
ncbi:hypothetical protein IPM65_03990 [Candidatus Roizmanbacteria bacterium]|nr:MAG: hypothetical protein IPM65_03990 [Candidatus Roizmanbacteria bacterium]